MAAGVRRALRRDVHRVQVDRRTRCSSQPESRFVFGYEQALGYLVCGRPLDKDGITAAVLLAEVAALAAAEGVTLQGRLDAHHRPLRPSRDGRHVGADDPGRRQPPRWRALRADPPTEVGGVARSPTSSGSTRPACCGCNSAASVRLQLRPSGTEPKVKLYGEAIDIDPGPLPRRPRRPPPRRHGARQNLISTSKFVQICIELGPRIAVAGSARPIRGVVDALDLERAAPRSSRQVLVEPTRSCQPSSAQARSLAWSLRICEVATVVPAVTGLEPELHARPGDVDVDRLARPQHHRMLAHRLGQADGPDRGDHVQLEMGLTRRRSDRHLGQPVLEAPHAGTTGAANGCEVLPASSGVTNPRCQRSSAARSKR